MCVVWKKEARETNQGVEDEKVILDAVKENPGEEVAVIADENRAAACWRRGREAKQLVPRRGHSHIGGRMSLCRLHYLPLQKVVNGLIGVGVSLQAVVSRGWPSAPQLRGRLLPGKHSLQLLLELPPDRVGDVHLEDLPGVSRRTSQSYRRMPSPRRTSQYFSKTCRCHGVPACVSTLCLPKTCRLEDVRVRQEEVRVVGRVNVHVEQVQAIRKCVEDVRVVGRVNVQVGHVHVEQMPAHRRPNQASCSLVPAERGPSRRRDRLVPVTLSRHPVPVVSLVPVVKTWCQTYVSPSASRMRGSAQCQLSSRSVPRTPTHQPWPPRT